jgi:hypothetical protein
MKRLVTLLSLALAANVATAACSAKEPADVPASPDAVGGLGSAPPGKPAPTSPRNPGAAPTKPTAQTNKSPTPSGPQIVYFRIKQAAKCPEGTTVQQTPAVPLIIEWKVTGVPKVTLSVDGPGIYNTYDAEGTETFTFSCGAAPGTLEKHTYLLKTVGADVSKSLAATAKVNEIAPV